MPPLVRAALLASALMFGATLAGAAAAGTLRVTPTTVELRPDRAATVMTLTNTGDRSMSVQLRMFSWSQVGGEDRLEPTRAVVASPPAATLAPGASQTVRIVHLSVANTRPDVSERSYRVLVDELPDPARREPGEVAMVLRQSIPIFFGGRTAPPDMAWTLRGGPGATQLVAVNTGGRRLRLSDLEIHNSDGTVAQKRGGLVGYVLPGAEMRWPLDLKQQNAAEALSLSVTTDLGLIRAALPPLAP